MAAKSMTAPNAPPLARPDAPEGSLLSRPVKVVTVGLDRFAAELEAQSVPVVHVAWQPPAGGDARLAALLAKLGA